MQYLSFIKTSKLFIFILERRYLNSFFKLHYKLAIWFVKKYANTLEANGLYIKGSFNYDHFRYGISDLDFVYIGNSNDFDRIKHKVQKLSVFFPQLGDIDTFSKEHFALTLEYSDLRFKEFMEWRVILENDYSIASNRPYLFLPLKYKIDQLSELHFQFEWLFENLKNKNNYNKLKTKRICIKILKIIKWIEENSLSSYHSFENESVDGLDLKDILHLIFSKITNSNYLSSLNNRFIDELGIATNYFDKDNECFVLGDKKLKISDKYEVDSMSDYVYPRVIFSLFHTCGFFSLDSIVELALKKEKSFTNVSIWSRIYGQMLIGEKSALLDKNIDYFKDCISNIEKYNLRVFGESEKLFGKDFFVTVNWGEDKQRFKSFYRAQKMNQKRQGDYNHLHVEFSNTAESFDFLKGNVLRIEFDKKNLDLWHKESLYNIASEFLFFSEVFIFSDADVYCENTHWISSSFKFIRNRPNQLVQCFSTVIDSIDHSYFYHSWTKAYLEGTETFEAPGLVWGIKSSFLREINFFPDMLFDGSNDGLLLQELTKYPMGRSSSFDWYTKNIRDLGDKNDGAYLGFDLIHINHGENRDYKNRGEYLDYFKEDFDNAYKKNCIGLFEVRDYRLVKILKLLKKGQLTAIDKDSILRYLAAPRYTKLTSVNSGFVECFNSLVELTESDQTYYLKNAHPHEYANAKLTPDLGIIYSEEGFRFLYCIEGDFEDVHGVVICDNYNDPSIVNIYENKSTNKHFIELCFNSWRDSADYAAEISIKIKPSCGVSLTRICNERVHLTHGWSEVIKDKFNFSDGPSYKLNGSNLLGESWYRVDFSFSNSVDAQVLISTLNQYSRNIINDRYFKIKDNIVSYVFYKNQFAKEVFLKVSSDDKLDGSFEVILRKRAILDPI